ncbi:AfsR/SARP family transcriptional regulator [Streptomyces sp. C8S0]|nr:BTAD domain-containing putative transcriptional regulator [Streptomyces sp. C8S0]
MDVRFTQLGPVGATVDGSAAELGGGPRTRRLLAALLLDAGRVVPAAGLAAAVWDDPPATAREQVQNTAARLRRSLAAVDGGAGCAVVRTGAGFRLDTGAAAVDLAEFRRLCRAAEAADGSETARALYGQALELWRGPALEGLEGRVLRAAADRLEEERLDCLQRRLAADLEAGRHAAAAPELAALVAAHPLRERLVELRMLALYRCGRRGEALEAYVQARSRLAEATGLDPGPALRELHAAVLADAPSLGPPAPRGAAPAVASPPSARSATEPRPAPAQLPAGAVALAGRSEEVSRLVRALEEAGGGVCVVRGQAGVGKTALALHAAHALRDRFPDGQLFADLRGADGHGGDPGDVLAAFLRALGVDGPAVPASASERAALYRTLLAGRRVLVVLDDAAGEAQVRPLLAGAAPGSAVLVTSRHRLAGLDVRLALGVPLLDDATALTLLDRWAGGGRVAVEPAAARGLVRLCGNLPLALRVVGARLAAAPHRDLGWLAHRLGDEQARLDELAHGGSDVRAALRLSYRGLSPRAKRLLRGLALLTALDYASWTAAAVLDEPLARAEAEVDGLVAAHLLEVACRDASGAVRYRMHDLVRAFARELACGRETEAVVPRVIGHWLALVREGRRAHQGVDYPGLPVPGQEEAVLDPAVRALPRAEPVRWPAGERDALVAAVRQAARVDPRACWELAAAAEYLFDLRSDLAGWYAVQQTGLAAARAAGDRRGEALMLAGLGRLRACREEWAEARGMLLTAERLFTAVGDGHGAAYAGWVLSYLDRMQGRLDEALQRCRHNAAVFEAAGDFYGLAHALRGTGQVLLARGETARVLELFTRALEAAVRGGAAWPRLCMLRWVAEARRLLGRLDEAAAGFGEILARTEDWGDLAGQSAARIGLGRIALDRGDAAAAVRQLRAAADVGRRSGQPLVHALAVPPLAEALLASGDPQAARSVLREAVEDCRVIGARPLLAALETALSALPRPGR